MAGPGQTPDRREKVLRAIKEGRFAVHALPFSLETESLDLEDLVRGMTFSANLARSVGIDIPRAAKMTDVPCHTWVVPTLLKHAGVKFLHIGCNGGSHVVKVPPLFWWEGPDGSRVLTEYSPELRHRTASAGQLALSHLAGDDHDRRQPGPADGRAGQRHPHSASRGKCPA